MDLLRLSLLFCLGLGALAQVTLDGDGDDFGDVVLDGGDDGDVILDGGEDDYSDTTTAPTDAPTDEPTTAAPGDDQGGSGNSECFDVVAGKVTPYCRGTCTEEVQATVMEGPDTVCVCKENRFGLNCASIPRSGSGSLDLSWSDEEVGKVIKPSPPNANPRQIRGVYIVDSAAACEAVCQGLNEGYDRKRRAPCAAITTTERDDGVLCEIYAVKPVKACQAWLTSGEGNTKWLVDAKTNDPTTCGL